VVIIIKIKKITILLILLILSNYCISVIGYDSSSDKLFNVNNIFTLNVSKIPSNNDVVNYLENSTYNQVFNNTIELIVKTNCKEYKWLVDIVIINICLKNNGSKDIRLEFPSLQRFDFIITNRIGREVYTWSNKKNFIDSVSGLIIPAGKKVEWNVTWRQCGNNLWFIPYHPVLPGLYNISVQIPAYNLYLETNIEIIIKPWISRNGVVLPDFPYIFDDI